MTNEEAINLLKNASVMGVTVDKSPLPIARAVEKAIKALEKQILKKQDKHFIENEFGFFCCKETKKQFAILL